MKKKSSSLKENSACLVWYTDDGKLRQRVLDEPNDNQKDSGKCSCCKKAKRIAARVKCRECKKAENFCSECLDNRKDQNMWLWINMQHKQCAKFSTTSAITVTASYE